ncbi:MAG: hypothetical protein B7Z80_02330 [Rhodospirillales bacterium 20-64-7]|nr:MAG: hypothetical protein B7Z80_02330 [Rhodospirillales bacterium 20-64-7]
MNDLMIQLDLVAHGLGVALLPAAFVAWRGAGKQPPAASAELKEPEPCWELAVVFAHDADRQPNNAITRLFLDVLRPTQPPALSS